MTYEATTTHQLNGSGRRGGTVAALRDVTTGELFQLATARQRWIMGTDPTCELRIGSDPFISAAHCVIERCEDGSLFVRDRQSRNGTYVDGNQVEGAELRVGAHLTIGRTSLIAISAASARGGDRDQRKAIELLRGRDPSLRITIEQAMRAAQTDCSVLVLGETGTGKDLIARLVHESSRRAKGPFVAVNCGAIPRELIASELFGHERGAFTGASEARDGYFVEANGGTLFLDEIGELPIELQPTLLRVLETRKVRRVGGQSDRTVDVRIVAATNRTDNLGSDNSNVRLDLYHRLATMILLLTPLRERMGDVVDLVESMLEELAPDFGTKEVTVEGWQALSAYSWPGNVRELRHAVARAVALGAKLLGPTDFFPQLRTRTRSGTFPGDLLGLPSLGFPGGHEGGGGNGSPGGTGSTGVAPGGSGGSAGDGGGGRGGGRHPSDPLVPYQAMMKTAMVQALNTYGTIRSAAQSLGMPKSTFADRVREFNIGTKKKFRQSKKRR